MKPFLVSNLYKIKCYCRVYADNQPAQVDCSTIKGFSSLLVFSVYIVLFIAPDQPDVAPMQIVKKIMDHIKYR